MTDQNPDREKLADEISGIVVGSGYYSMSIGRDAALEAADAILASEWLAEHDERVRREAAAEQREKDARIAETRYFGGGSTGSANRWGAKQAAAAIREQETE